MANERKKLAVILSDIEMGEGGSLDDFPHTEFLCEFIARYNESQYENLELDLIFNGDTFDFLKIGIKGKHPHLINSDIALKKLEIVKKAHGQFFEAIEKFLEFGNRPRRVHFITGNHDMELFFPEVKNEIIKLCGGSGQVLFPGFSLDIGDVHIEHGNQIDSIFRINPEDVFIEHQGSKILNLPWSTVTLLNVIMPHRNDFYELDRIKPRHIVFDKIPSLKEFILGLLWTYWTQDYIKSNDPLKRVSWSMVREAFKRSFMFNPDVELEDKLFERMKISNEYKVYVVGHMHETKVVTYGDRKVVQMGCFRDEFMFTRSTESFEIIPKTYLEIELQGNKMKKLNILEELILELAEGRIPKSFDSYKDVIARKLGTPEKRLQNKIEIEKQEDKEKKD